jgi:hypothetical protein
MLYKLPVAAVQESTVFRFTGERQQTGLAEALPILRSPPMKQQSAALTDKLTSILWLVLWLVFVRDHGQGQGSVSKL